MQGSLFLYFYEIWTPIEKGLTKSAQLAGGKCQNMFIQLNHKRGLWRHSPSARFVLWGGEEKGFIQQRDKERRTQDLQDDVFMTQNAEQWIRILPQSFEFAERRSKNVPNVNLLWEPPAYPAYAPHRTTGTARDRPLYSL